MFPDISELEVLEYTEEAIDSVKRHLTSFINESKGKGIPPKVDFDRFDKDLLVGRCYILDSDPLQKQEEKRRLKFMEEIQKRIQRDLQPTEFGELCAKYLSVEFGGEVKHIGKPHDKGVDLVGYTYLPTHALRLKVGIWGQAKCHKNRLDVKTLSQFVGDLKRFKEGREMKGVKPLVFLLTSSDFTSGLKRQAKKEGIIPIDGEQIAYFLVKRGIGFVKDNRGNPSFSIKKLKAWVSS